MIQCWFYSFMFPFICVCNLCMNNNFEPWCCEKIIWNIKKFVWKIMGMEVKQLVGAVISECINSPLPKIIADKYAWTQTQVFAGTHTHMLLSLPHWWIAVLTTLTTLTAVQSGALSNHSKKVLGSNPAGAFRCGICMFPLCLRGLPSTFPGFSAQSNDVHALNWL